MTEHEMRLKIWEYDCSYGDITPDVIHCPIDKPCMKHRLEAELKGTEWVLQNEQEYTKKLKEELGELLLETAERQREACALQLHGLLTLKNATAIWASADDIRETPLVIKKETK